MSNLLTVDHISKSYGRFEAVRGISFSVSSGSIFGLLGPNGAGKTSTIRMLTGITLPDSGSITLFGEPQRAEHQNRIGYMPEERGLYKKLSVRNQLEYLGALKGLKGKNLSDRIDYWLARFEIQSWQKKKTSDLSKGMQQKLQFIATVLHEPELLILDEPLSGLDPVNAELINGVILDLRRQGRTIILSTHQMEQVEQLCDEIILVNKGEIVLAGGVRELKRGSGRQLIRIQYEGVADVRSMLVNSGATVIEDHPNELVIEIPSHMKSNTLLRSATDLVDILKWELIEPPIKELFLKAVADKQPQEVMG